MPAKPRRRSWLLARAPLAEPRRAATALVEYDPDLMLYRWQCLSCQSGNGTTHDRHAADEAIRIHRQAAHITEGVAA